MAVKNPADITDLLANIATIEHHEHSRSRVYPRDVEAVATLIAGHLLIHSVTG